MTGRSAQVSSPAGAAQTAGMALTTGTAVIRMPRECIVATLRSAMSAAVGQMSSEDVQAVQARLPK